MDIFFKQEEELELLEFSDLILLVILYSGPELCKEEFVPQGDCMVYLVDVQHSDLFDFKPKAISRALLGQIGFLYLKNGIVRVRYIYIVERMIKSLMCKLL